MKYLKNILLLVNFDPRFFVMLKMKAFIFSILFLQEILRKVYGKKLKGNMRENVPGLKRPLRNPTLDTRISRLCLFVTLMLPPPWILKRAGLESSGQGLSKRIAFFEEGKNPKKI